MGVAEVACTGYLANHRSCCSGEIVELLLVYSGLELEQDCFIFSHQKSCAQHTYQCDRQAYLKVDLMCRKLQKVTLEKESKRCIFVFERALAAASDDLALTHITVILGTELCTRKHLHKKF